MTAIQEQSTLKTILHNSPKAALFIGETLFIGAIGLGAFKKGGSLKDKKSQPAGRDDILINPPNAQDALDIVTNGAYGKHNPATQQAAKTLYEHGHHIGMVDSHPTLPVKLTSGEMAAVIAEPGAIIEINPRQKKQNRPIYLFGRWKIG